MPILTTGAGKYAAAAGGAYTGPGDVLTGALAWWGMRGYNAAYAGPCIDISDEFGGTPTTIGIASNRVNVAAIQTYEGLHGQAYIDKWYDQTGNGYHMVVGNQRAKLIQNAIGSVYPVGRFDQSHADYYKVTAGLTRSQPFFVSWVGRRTANFTTAQAAFASAGANGTSAGFANVANTLAIAAYTGTGASGAGTADNSFHAVQCNFNGDPNSDIMADGTRYTGLVPSTEGLAGQMTLGSNLNATTAQFTGDLCEVGVWPGLQTSGTETSMNTNQHGTSGYNF